MCQQLCLELKAQAVAFGAHKGAHTWQLNLHKITCKSAYKCRVPPRLLQRGKGVMVISAPRTNDTQGLNEEMWDEPEAMTMTAFKAMPVQDMRTWCTFSQSEPRM